MKIEIGQEWPKGSWVYVTSWTDEKRWFQATGLPANEDGSSLRREDDELSEEEANALGFYRPTN